MSNNNSNGGGGGGCGCGYLIVGIIIGIIGYTKNDSSIFFFFFDWFFWPFVVLKWIICQDITLTIIHHSFPWFFR